MTNIGDAVGVIAAQSIGEPGTQLTMRTFHIGGVAQGGAQSSTIVSDYNGVVKLENEVVIEDRQGSFIIMSRNTEMRILDESGRVRERHRLQYGSKLKVKTGDSVKKGETIVEWDPYNTPIITEKGGAIKYLDLVLNDSLVQKTDESTGIVSSVVSRPSNNELKPRIVLYDKSGEVVKLANGMEAKYNLPEGALLSVKDGDMVETGDIVAKRPRETSKTKDITGGLPRVAELFEARMPKNFSVMSSIEGYVEFGKDYKTKRKVLVKPKEGDPVEYLIPKGKHITVNEGDLVRPGDALTEGAPVLHDILEVSGIEALAEHLVQEVQSVYRLQGVKIDDKHIEVIIRQMILKVEITDVGSSDLVVGEEIDRHEVIELNEKNTKAGRELIQYKSVLKGITKASLHTNSFISAASFQETTRVLTDAAVNGKSDELFGLKENVIVGRLIPAGTGEAMRQVKNLAIKADAKLMRKNKAKAQSLQLAKAEELSAAATANEGFESVS